MNALDYYAPAPIEWGIMH